MSDICKIGVLGGSFDPVHAGHLNIARTAAQKLQLDKVLLIPVGISPYKDKCCCASADNRLEMLSIAVRNEALLSVSSLEVDSPQVSYTVRTIEKLCEIYPQAQLYFIIGADAFCKIFSWYMADVLIRSVRFAVFNRGNVDITVCAEQVASCGGEVFPLHCPHTPVSSSEIRSWFCDIEANLPLIRKFVHNDVISYILENHIYP